MHGSDAHSGPGRGSFFILRMILRQNGPFYITIMQMGHLPDRLLRWAGSETLENGGDWQYPPNSLHKFFKVSVEVP